MLGARLECLHQPTPRHFGQQWVDGLGRVQISLDESDQPHRPVPGFGAVGVVQQDQPTERIALGSLGHDFTLGAPDLGAERIAVRRETLRWAKRAELDFRPHLSGVHRRHRLAELGRDFLIAPGTGTWQSFTGRLTNARANVREATAAALRHGAEGILMTAWGDNGYHQPWPTLWIPLGEAAASAGV